MDSNQKIIEAVRQEPAIYGNYQSLEERNRVWKKLSAKLNIQEQYLKIRWHYLVQRYRSEVDFKYAHQMQFLQRKTKTNIQEGNWPEFVITEEDLHDQQQDGDEFEFVELDDVNNASKPIKEERDKEKENPYSDKITTNRNVKTTRIPHNSQEKEKTLNIVIQSVDTLYKADSDEKRDAANNRQITVVKSKSALESTTKTLDTPLDSKLTDLAPIEGEGQKGPEIVESLKDNNEYKKEEPRREEIKIEPPPPSRCEDDIFGELVSAMLKRMDEAKKKNVKKEIINLLLT